MHVRMKPLLNPGEGSVNQGGLAAAVAALERKRMNPPSCLMMGGESHAVAVANETMSKAALLNHVAAAARERVLRALLSKEQGGEDRVRLKLRQ
jgi:hypothetical protein